MKKAIHFILLLAALCSQAAAQEASIFPLGEVSTPNIHHTGTVWLSELTPVDSLFNLGLAQATFAPGAKLDWHIHPAGQYLLITAGTGYYQERGKPIQNVQKGDVIKCLPGIEHWHGAAPNSGFAYIGVSPTQNGRTIWLKRVTDEEYRSNTKSVAMRNTTAEQEILQLSKQKWQWMSDKTIEPLNALFHEKSMFIHMGGTWGKERELDIIKTGSIWYKKAEIYSASVNIIGNTAILLNDIDLEAVVGGNTVTNPFMVTEVYVSEDGKWKLGSLTFSRLTRPVKLGNNGGQR